MTRPRRLVVGCCVNRHWIGCGQIRTMKARQTLNRVARKKRLTCLVSHEPNLESCLPILDRVARRGRVEVDLVLNERLLKTQADLRQVLSHSPIQTRVQSRFRIEFLSYLDMRRADAVLSYGDPFALRKGVRLRDRYLPASGTPSIFIQHGFIQEGVNLDSDQLGDEWYSSLILWWADNKPEDTPFISADVRKRVRVIGFTKKNLMPPRAYPADFLQFVNSFEKRILVCTAIPRKNKRFSEDSLQSLYRMLDTFCRRNPDCLVMLRPHRARSTQLGLDADEAPLGPHKNLLVMDRHSGPFAYSTIHHSLQLSTMVIGHASSAILDAVYTDQPTAMIQNDWPDFAPLPAVDDLESLEHFVATADRTDIMGNDLRRRFGEIDSNLDKAADHIETLLSEGAAT